LAVLPTQFLAVGIHFDTPVGTMVPTGGPAVSGRARLSANTGSARYVQPRRELP